MNVAFILAWWHIPAIVSVLALAWAFFWPFEGDDRGWFSGIARLFALVPAMFVSALAWAIAGALK